MRTVTICVGLAFLCVVQTASAQTYISRVIPQPAREKPEVEATDQLIPEAPPAAESDVFPSGAILPSRYSAPRPGYHLRIADQLDGELQPSPPVPPSANGNNRNAPVPPQTIIEPDPNQLPIEGEGPGPNVTWQPSVRVGSRVDQPNPVTQQLIFERAVIRARERSARIEARKWAGRSLSRPKIRYGYHSVDLNAPMQFYWDAWHVPAVIIERY